jgi:hypothetical protein
MRLYHYGEGLISLSSLSFLVERIVSKMQILSKEPGKSNLLSCHTKIIL